MERLTERFKNGQAAVLGCGNNCKYDYKYCNNYLKTCPTITEIYEKLATYEDAEEQGLHLRLPCKVGTQIYTIIYDFEQEKYMITETEIIEVTENCNGWFFKSFKNILAFRLSDFGVRVFFTKSEAEAKLKELRGSND